MLVVAFCLFLKFLRTFFNVMFCVFVATCGHTCDGLRRGIFVVLFLFDVAIIYLVLMSSLGCVFGVLFSRFCGIFNCFRLVCCNFMTLHFIMCG